MNEENTKKSILKKIEKGEITMHSKGYFFLKGLLLLLGVILSFAFAFYLVSLILAVLYRSGLWFAPGFGIQGIMIFLQSFPWVLLAGLFAFVILLEVFMKQYAFTYRKPLVYSATGIVVLVVAAGVVVGSTSLHAGFFEQAQRGKLPFAGPLYRYYEAGEFGRVHLGNVLAARERELFMERIDGKEFFVVFTRATRVPVGQVINEHDFIVVIGQENDDVIEAQGIRKLDYVSRPLLKHHLMRMPGFERSK